MMGNWNYGCGFGWPGSTFWPVFMVIFLVLIIWIVVVLVRTMTNHGEKIQKKDSAMDILKERYVKGEVSKEEFEEKREDLQKVINKGKRE